MKKLLLLNMAILLAITVFGQKERTAIDEKDKWNLSHLYANEKAWEEARDKIVAEITALAKVRHRNIMEGGDLHA